MKSPLISQVGIPRLFKCYGNEKQYANAEVFFDHYSFLYISYAGSGAGKQNTGQYSFLCNHLPAAIAKPAIAQPIRPYIPGAC